MRHSTTALLVLAFIAAALLFTYRVLPASPVGQSTVVTLPAVGAFLPSSPKFIDESTGMAKYQAAEGYCAQDKHTPPKRAKCRKHVTLGGLKRDRVTYNEKTDEELRTGFDDRLARGRNACAKEFRHGLSG